MLRWPRIECDRLLELGNAGVPQPTVAPPARRFLQLDGELPADALDQPAGAERILRVQVLDQLPYRCVFARSRELEQEAPVRRVVRHAGVLRPRWFLLGEVVHAQLAAQHQGEQLDVQRPELPAELLQVLSALAGETEPSDDLVGARPF